MKRILLYGCLLFLASTLTAADFSVIKTLEPIPEDHPHHLSAPHAMDIDTQGNIYLSDGVAGVVFSWNSKGKFRKTIGSPGKGPGEFQFVKGGGRGMVACGAEKVFVYDGAMGNISVFDMNGDYLGTHSAPKAVKNREVHQFYVTAEGNYLFLSRKMGATPLLSVDLTNREALLQTIRKVDDKSISIKGGSNGPVITLWGYPPMLILNYNFETNTALMGFSEQNTFELIDISSNESSKIKTNLRRTPISNKEKEAFSSQDFIKQSGFKVAFNEFRPAYDGVIFVEGNRFFVYHHKTINSALEGIVIDESSKSLGKASLNLVGEAMVFNPKSRIYLFTENNDGDFVINELSLVMKK
ncbi:MAG: 6-bladed beta-propeller [Acidobacteriota bacterium]|nr:6-bladed beta-propeller [Acidobacteriota bacterium]